MCLVRDVIYYVGYRQWELCLHVCLYGLLGEYLLSRAVKCCGFIYLFLRKIEARVSERVWGCPNRAVFHFIFISCIICCFICYLFVYCFYVNNLFVKMAVLYYSV
jgi:hypothetical protein